MKRIKRLPALALCVSFSIALCVLAAVPAFAASERDAVMATVAQFIDGLNKGDVNAASAACASQTVIIDDFPPHVWQGPNACAVWYAGFVASNKAAGDLYGSVLLGTPSHVDITGDRAYVVAPARYTYKHGGKTIVESGSIFTVALQKITAGWRIAGWAWADH